jgi:hypothetical protein
MGLSQKLRLADFDFAQSVFKAQKGSLSGAEMTLFELLGQLSDFNF